jgi:hypothetical protein
MAIGFIAKLAIGIVLFGGIFSALFMFFADVESYYGSDYNSSANPALNQTKYLSQTEMEVSYNSSELQRAKLVNGSTSSDSAFDNIMSVGWGVVQTIFNPFAQAKGIISYVLGSVFNIPYDDNYAWVYYTIFTIILMLLIFSVLGVIFRYTF